MQKRVLAIRGLGAFVAGGALRIASQVSAERVLDELFGCYGRTDQEEEGGGGYHRGGAGDGLRFAIEILQAATAVFVSLGDGAAGCTIEVDVRIWLERFVRKLLVDYPAASRVQRMEVRNALGRCFAGLGAVDRTALNQVLELAADCGMHRAIAKNDDARAWDLINPEGEPDPHLCWVYGKLFTGLIEQRDAAAPAAPLEAERKSEVPRLVYDAFMSKALSMIDTFNLGYKEADPLPGSSNEGSRPVPYCPRDQECLISLAHCLDTCLLKFPELFQSWAIVYFENLIKLSRLCPLVSALYKLITLGLKLAGWKSDSSHGTEDGMELQAGNIAMLMYHRFHLTRFLSPVNRRGRSSRAPQRHEFHSGGINGLHLGRGQCHGPFFGRAALLRPQHGLAVARSARVSDTASPSDGVRAALRTNPPANGRDHHWCTGRVATQESRA